MNRETNPQKYFGTREIKGVIPKHFVKCQTNMSNDTQEKTRTDRHKETHRRPDRGDGERKPLVAIHPRTRKDFAKDAPVNRGRESND